MSFYMGSLRKIYICPTTRGLCEKGRRREGLIAKEDIIWP